VFSSLANENLKAKTASISQEEEEENDRVLAFMAALKATVEGSCLLTKLTAPLYVALAKLSSYTVLPWTLGTQTDVNKLEGVQKKKGE